MVDRLFTRPVGRLVPLPPSIVTAEAMDARRHIPLEGAFNFRDLGGYRTADGSTVRWRTVFRSDHLHDLTDADRATIAALGLHTVIDFRLPFEREDRPSRLEPVPRTLHLGMADAPGAEEDVRRVMEAIRGEAPAPDWSHWFATYHSMLDSSAPMFVRTIEALAQPDSLPAMFHCTGGKDRTGMAAVLLLGLLGVPARAVLDDFELTNVHRTPRRVREMAPRLLANGVDEDHAHALLGVVPAAMADAYRRVVDEHGGAEAFLVGRGLDPAVPDRLREILLVR